MTTKQTFALVAIITMLSFGIGWYLYPMLPENIASHWGANGKVNGSMPKFWGLFFIPLLMIFLSTLLFLSQKAVIYSYVLFKKYGSDKKI